MAAVVHADRYSNSNVVPRKKGVVIHTSEGGELATSDEQLIYFMTLPGDRVSDVTGRRYGASYHAVTDGDNAAYIQVLPATAGPYSAPPLNKTWWHICCPGKAGQTREQWLDARSRGQIKALAKFIVDKHNIDGFPIKKLTVAELQAGGEGYVGHADVSYAFKQSDHTDPGKNFPWDVLAADITALLYHPTDPSPKEDTVEALDRPYRLYDSRVVNKPLAVGEVREVGIVANEVVINVTVARASGDGYLTVWGRGKENPGTSNVNFKAGEAVANLVRTKTDGGIIRFEASAPCHIAVDVQAVGAEA